MISEPNESAVLEGTLQIMPSVRREVEAYSEKEGVSLDQFVTVALAERLAHLRHQEWVSKRNPVTEAQRRWALALLDARVQTK